MDHEKDTMDFSMDDILRQLQEATLENDAMDNAPENSEPAPASPQEEHSPEPPQPPTEAEPEEIATMTLSLSEETDTADTLEFFQLAFSQVAQEPADSQDALGSTDPLGGFVPAKEFASEETIPGTQEEVPPLFAEESAFSQGEQEPVTAETAPHPEQPVQEDEALPNEGPRTIPLDRSAKLRDLKRKLVAGPEKRYYSLSEVGVGRLQIGMILNFIILLLCGIAILLDSRGMVPASRNKLLIFSQVLALMVSGLLGCGLMMDGIGDLFHLRYSLNTTLAISFIACMADAWFCLDEQRVPFCAAFVLEMSAAMLARYHKHTTEMAQLDTMRKATSLTSLVKEPQFYEKRAGILRGQGDVEDFMETYSRVSGPEIVQRVYAFVALLACIGIAVLTYLLHGTSMAVKIFSTSLLVSVPTGYFLALTRPTALLERRLHMVGAVICGWQGVKKLCGKAVIPLRDKDLFPRGSTKLNGIKFYSDRPSAQVVSYAASLIFAAGGGLVPLFRNLLVSRSGSEYPVEGFQDYGRGGIGGEVNGEPVLLGSSEFLQEMGVDIPQGTMVNQAVYVSIDGQLAAVIAISYAKMRSASAGLVSLCGCRKLKTLLLAGDFMMTDSFIRDKFSIRTRRLILPPMEDRAELASRKANPESDVLALVTRDDLVSTAYAITGAMSLRTACRVGTIIGIAGGIIGIIIMLSLSYLGSTELLSPARVILYQLVWMIPSLLATEWTRVV